MIQQILFLLTLGVAIFFIRKRVVRIRSNINLGKAQTIDDRKSDRFQNMMLVAFGQKKMFKRFIPAILHLFIYVGFLVINLEVLEFVIDGLAGTHRIFAPYLGGFYNVLMNIFEFLAIAHDLNLFYRDPHKRSDLISLLHIEAIQKFCAPRGSTQYAIRYQPFSYLLI